MLYVVCCILWVVGCGLWVVGCGLWVGVVWFNEMQQSSSVCTTKRLGIMKSKWRCFCECCSKILCLCRIEKVTAGAKLKAVKIPQQVLGNVNAPEQLTGQGSYYLIETCTVGEQFLPPQDTRCCGKLLDLRNVCF